MRLPSILACCLLSACVTLGPPPDYEARDRAEATRPICQGVEDCQVKWDATQLWIVHNAAMKIQTATNVIIETYGVTSPEAGFAMRATKEPLGGGKYKIELHVWCANVLGCTVDPVREVLAFNQAIGAVTP